MLRLFFVPERELPAGVGFRHFGPEHRMVLAVLAVLSAGITAWGCRMKERGRIRLLRTMAGIMVALEIWKDGMLAGMGSFSVGYLPLHLCSIAMFLCLWFAWRPGSDLAGQLVWSVCFPAGVAALLFPDWTNMPLLQFQSLHSFLYHGMLIQFALIAVISGQIRPRIGHAWKTVLFLIVLAAGVYGINLRLGTNFMFLNHPLPGTPLMLCAHLPGRWGYLAGYGLLAAGVILLTDLPFFLWNRVRSRKRSIDKM